MASVPASDAYSWCRILSRGGAYASILCEQELVKELDWSRRVVVVRNVAQALPYLHRDCDDPIVHCNIKSSNILLDHKEYMKLHS